ncbi:MAG: cadmium-translocating P-type ATPase [Armatimonadetes bacterium]|nr:cadmium-translocating P-type ATPase [Armatimonadota bacterium]
MAEKKVLSLPVLLPPAYEECDRCVGRLRDSLLQIEGILSVEVDRENSTLTLAYDPHLARMEDVERRAKHIGVEIGERFEHLTLTLVGLDCPDCAIKLEKNIGRMNGVLWASTNFAASKLSVEYEPRIVNASDVAKKIRQLGYDVREAEAELAGQPQREQREIIAPEQVIFTKHVAITFIAGLLLVVAIALSTANQLILARILYAASVVVGGYYAARGAFYSLRSFVLDMNFLMTLAAIGAIVIGEWFDAAMVMFLFSLGNTLEARTIERARDSIRSLINLFPTKATVKRNGGEEQVDISLVKAGDVLIIRPGERIPTDCEVISGRSTVDQSPITGESTPVEKTIGDLVFAGTINQRGSLEARAVATAEDNTLARILHLVEEAQAEKAPTQRFAELFGRYYTPVVVGLAVVIALVPPLLYNAMFRDWLYRALTLLVVACPCALVISTPVAIVSAIGNAAKKGILIKGGTHLETAGGIRVVAFDKTGTLTTGEAKVTDIIPAGNFTREQVLSLAAGVESRSEHPLAQAILHEARKENIKPHEVTDFEALTGMGAAAKLNGDVCIVGNTRLMDQFGIEYTEYTDKVRTFQQDGKTVVMIAYNRTLAGIIALSDTVRESARRAFEDLRSAGVERILMITGDNEATARAVARDLGVDEYYAELLPQDKVDIVRLLVERFHKVAVVGDGVNDAPAMAVASLGVAMGAAGSPIALETADIALMSDDLSRLPFAMRLSRRTLATIKENIAFSLLIIVVLVCTALLGWLKLSLGVFGHEGSALLVIANGMRLLRFR